MLVIPVTCAFLFHWVFWGLLLLGVVWLVTAPSRRAAMNTPPAKRAYTYAAVSPDGREMTRAHESRQPLREPVAAFTRRKGEDWHFTFIVCEWAAREELQRTYRDNVRFAPAVQVLV